MEALNTIEPITIAEFMPAVIRFKMAGWRVVQICASRLDIDEAQTVPSITQVYPGAFLQENETAELFGVRIESIDGDYHGKLYRIAQETPFKQKG